MCTSKLSLQTENKQLYQNVAQQSQAIIDSIEPCIKQMEQEEPQYKQ